MSVALISANPKFLLLVRDLKMPAPWVRGHLDTLWDICHAKADPVVGSAEEVEAAADWRGEEGLFFNTLLKRNWIELVPGSADRYQVHDYWENAPYYVHDRLKKKKLREEKKRNNPGQSKKVPDESGTIPDESGKVGENPTLALALALKNHSQSLDDPSSPPPPAAKVEKPKELKKQSDPLREYLEQHFPDLSDHQRHAISRWEEISVRDAEEVLEVWEKRKTSQQRIQNPGGYQWSMFESVRVRRVRKLEADGQRMPMSSFVNGGVRA